MNLETWNWRTGTHTYKKGKVWPQYDGPDFDGYFKAVEVDGKLVAVESTLEEYETYVEKPWGYACKCGCGCTRRHMDHTGSYCDSCADGCCGE